MPAKVLQFLSQNALVFWSGIGMGIYRVLHEWPVWYNDTIYHGAVDPVFAGTDFFIFIDSGKVLGLLIYFALCFAIDRERKCLSIFLAPSILASICLAVPALYTLGIPIPPAIMLLSLFGIGVAIGMLFAQWIEFFGTIPPVRTVQALAISYITRFLLLPLFVTPSVLTDSLGILGLSIFSVLILGWCFQQTESLPLALRQLEKPFLFWRQNGLLLLFVIMFACAYGLGSGVTDLSHAPIETGLGKVIPSVVVVVVAFRLGDRFDRTILYAFALPLMAAGLLGVVFLGLPLSVSQVLLSAGFSMFHLLIYVMICSVAYRSRFSSMPAGVLVRGLALVAADVAILVFKTLPDDVKGLCATVVVVVTIAVGFATFLYRSGYEGVQSSLSEASSEERLLLDLAHSHGLSDRETTVFLLIREGKTATQISEELFISNGAVRAHSSRIYDKFGVHNRKDFDALFVHD